MTAAVRTAEISARATSDTVDAYRFGTYRGTPETVPAFRDRLNDGRLGRFPAVAGRYHLYTAAPSPAAHRVAILRSLVGLETAVSMSCLDPVRDARGWGFRGPTGEDPINGFTLLRDAYEASRPGYRGRVDVPVLWDRVERRIVSDDAITIGIDLATRFGPTELYRVGDADEIERIGAGIARDFTGRLATALHDHDAAQAVRDVLRRADRRLSERRFVLGDTLTDADVRWWVAIVRYDVGVNAHRTLGPALPAYRSLWRWAGELYANPAFRSATDLDAFAAPFTDLAHWDADRA